MTAAIVVPTSIGAAFAFAGSTSLKHVSAGHGSGRETPSTHRLLEFIRSTVVHRLWLMAIALDAAGVTLQMIALHLGAMALVQPLLTLGLVFALVFRRWHDREQVSRRQIVAGVLLTLTLGAFLVATFPASATAQRIDRMPAAAVTAACLVIAGGCVAAATRRRAHAAVLLGIALGVIYAGTAALLKSVTGVIARSPWHVFISWSFYAVLLLGAIGLLLNQIAFRAGPLSASLPAATAVDPVLSILIGVVAYDEQLPRGLRHLVLLVVLLVALCLAAAYLARGPQQRGAKAS